MKSSESEPIIVAKAIQTIDGFGKDPVSSRINVVKTTMPVLFYRRS